MSEEWFDKGLKIRTQVMGKTYTDAAGVVHLTDTEPPKSTPSPTAPPPDATP